MENSTINTSKVFIYTMCLIFMLKEIDLFQLAQYVITKDTSDFPKSNGLTIFNTRINVYLSFCTSPFLFIAIVLEKISNLQIENQGHIAILGTNYTRNLIQRKKICFLERITEKKQKSHISLLYMPHILYHILSTPLPYIFKVRNQFFDWIFLFLWFGSLFLQFSTTWRTFSGFSSVLDDCRKSLYNFRPLSAASFSTTRSDTTSSASL